jgi:proteasome lid subunit RPN8/RPN11
METDWKNEIREYWGMVKEDAKWNFPNADAELFLASIWKASKHDLDGMEVQVVIDAHDNIFISSGTPSFVSFLDHEDELNEQKMCLPIKCWIHTHPFGEAYFSSTDWGTINTWKTVMINAVVLGNLQYYAYNLLEDTGKKIYFNDDGDVMETLFFGETGEEE